MIHHPHDVPGAEGVLTLLVPTDPSRSWFLQANHADGVSWRTLPDWCEIELSPALVAALTRALRVQVMAASIVELPFTAALCSPSPPPVPSMDAPPPLPFVVDAAEPTFVLGGEG